MPKIPGWKRVKRQLDKAGAHGVTRVDFLAPDVCDGLEPITNFPGRIYDLRHAHGLAIVAQGQRDGCDIYMYAMYQRKPADDLPVASADARAETRPDPVEGQQGSPGHLFELPHQPASPYEEAA